MAARDGSDDCEHCPQTVAAFFDIDETLIRGASSYHVTRELYRRRFFGWRDIFFALRHTVLYILFGEDKDRVDALTHRALNVMAGHSVDEVVSVGVDVANELMEHRIFPGAQALLTKHLQAGHEVWLLSATPVQVAQVIGKRLGVTGVVGTEVKTENGVFLPTLDAPFMHGAGKGKAVRRLANERQINLEKSFAYSDSFNDLPMLLTVGRRAAINPDLKLRAYALKFNWKIVDFRRFKRGSIEKAAKRIAEYGGLAWLLGIFTHSLVRGR